MKEKYLSLKIVKNNTTGTIGLVPNDDATQLALHYLYENGEREYSLQVPKSQRDVTKHRQGFAIIKMILDNVDAVYLEKIIHEDISNLSSELQLDKLRKALLIATGFSETTIINASGMILSMQTAKSMSFEKMTEEEYSKFRHEVRVFMTDFLKELNIGWDNESINNLFKNF